MYNGNSNLKIKNRLIYNSQHCTHAITRMDTQSHINIPTSL
jgi:hypothetical protein